MKLISMTDFVLQQLEIKQSTSEFKEVVKKYATFLKKTLTISMFVPCDENGNILEKPNYYSAFLNHYYLDKPGLIDYESCQAYKQAENNVLFNGFEMHDILFFNDDLGIAYNVEEIEHWDIEILATIHTNIELTKSAINQIFY